MQIISDLWCVTHFIDRVYIHRSLLYYEHIKVNWYDNNWIIIIFIIYAPTVHDKLYEFCYTYSARFYNTLDVQ